MASAPTVTSRIDSATLTARFAAYVAEQYPFAAAAAVAAFEQVLGASAIAEPQDIETLRQPLAHVLRKLVPDIDRKFRKGETTPGINIATRLDQAREELVEGCDGFLRREAIAASLSRDERREILHGMLLTRATDNRLKQFFSSGEVRYGNATFQGKGFRSLGQEAIYASSIRIRRGDCYRSDDQWSGDVVAPLIRDLGAALAMRPHRDTVRMVLNAQMAKAGPPMNGKDLHIGDFSWGILPATAPLGVSTATVGGLALAFAREGSGRVAISFIGEGGASLGEWHETINLCAARKLPAVFCVENNQTALSTPVSEQSSVRVFAEKAAGYGIPGVTIDGTDPDAVAAAFTWAAERARAGDGPSLIELVAMRMCGHAHHDDMLYVGKEPPLSWTYPKLTDQGYANRELWEFWSERDPIAIYAERLLRDGDVEPGELEQWKEDVEALVNEAARDVIAASWPDGAVAGEGVFASEPPRKHVEVLEAPSERAATLPMPELDAIPPADPKGKTFLEAVMLGVADALASDPRVFVYGEDVGGRYGNAFLLLRPLLKAYGDRIINSTLSEGGILGVCVGAALAGQRPIGEIQFNDFVASGFNQLVNNAAKIRYRWGGSVPMVVRMPWGGLRHAGPYHSQNTEPWFYRTPGIRIVVPSTPADARAFMASALLDPDPVLYYEHIALYRDPRIRQPLTDAAPEPLPLGKAALRRAGSHLGIISYGAYVHHALRVAERLTEDGIEAAVLDLRSIVPLDRDAVLALARHCSRILIVHEDSRTGGIGESVAAIIQEEAFDFLDAPVRILGALDTPVPYSPPLEDYFLVSEAQIERAARLLVAY